MPYSYLKVNPQKYKGLVSGLKTISAEEGAAAVWKGWAPTLIGYVVLAQASVVVFAFFSYHFPIDSYSLQGAFKYGLYEFFKDTYANALGEDNYKKYKPLVWCAGSASAEVFADIVRI